MGMKRYVAAAAVATLTAGSALTAPASATQVGGDGCTPGYWKNHTESWQEYRTTDTLGGDIDPRPNGGDKRFALSADPAFAKYGDTTFAQALALKGGPGLDGAFQVLMRATTAAFLNAAYDDKGDDPAWDGYPYRRFAEPGDILGMVNGALESRDRTTMLAVATMLDDANNLGCPLN
jgi:hypothetical protein